MRGAFPRSCWPALAVLLVVAPPGSAHEGSSDARNRVSFQVSSTRVVANDWITAVVGVTDEDSDAARLADRVNRAMAWALEQAKGAEGIEVQSLGYRTHPVYDDGKIVRWSAEQDLQLETSDVAALSALLGELQSRVQLRGISFGVSPETQKSTEQELVTEALTAYRERAEQIRGALGARDHALISLAIHTPGSGVPPQPRMMRSMAMAEMAAAPSFEGGESTLTVSVDATIELER